MRARYCFFRTMQVVTLTGVSGIMNAGLGAAAGAVGTKFLSTYGYHYDMSDEILIGVKGGAIYGAAANFLSSPLYFSGFPLTKCEYAVLFSLFFIPGQIWFNGLIGYFMTNRADKNIDNTFLLFLVGGGVVSAALGGLFLLSFLLKKAVSALFNFQRAGVAAPLLPPDAPVERKDMEREPFLHSVR